MMSPLEELAQPRKPFAYEYGVIAQMIEQRAQKACDRQKVIYLRTIVSRGDLWIEYLQDDHQVKKVQLALFEAHA